MHCVYDTQTSEETRSSALRRENNILRRDLDRMERLLHDLTSLPEPQSLELLKRVRLDASTNSAYRHSETQIDGEHGSAGIVLPSIQSEPHLNGPSQSDDRSTIYAGRSAPQDSRDVGSYKIGAPRYYFIEPQSSVAPSHASVRVENFANSGAIRP